MRILFLLPFIFSSTILLADEWLLLHHNNGENLYIHSTSIQSIEGNFSIRNAIDKLERNDGKDISLFDGVKSVLTHNQFDCKNKLHRVISIRLELQNNKQREVHNKALEWKKIPNNSTAELEWQKVCSVSIKK